MARIGLGWGADSQDSVTKEGFGFASCRIIGCCIKPGVSNRQTTG